VCVFVDETCSRCANDDAGLDATRASRRAVDDGARRRRERATTTRTRRDRWPVDEGG
jgi:hypothetical protein